MKTKVLYCVEACYSADNKWHEWSFYTPKPKAKQQLARERKLTAEQNDGYKFRLVRVTTTREVVKDKQSSRR